MKYFLITFVFLLACSLASSTVFSAAASVRAVTQTAQALVESNGCNANVCLAVDGSGSVTEENFVEMQRFIINLNNIIGVDETAEYAAVQYGFINYPISPLTTDRRLFQERVLGAEFQSDTATFIGAGIAYCDFQLRQRPGEANKLVVLGDGENTVGGDPVADADRFREANPGGRVTAVGVGYEDPSVLQAIAGGDPNSVLEVTEFVDLGLIILDLVKQVCDIA
ncbi:von Willebrand factor A-like protein [Gracilaria domingensis]|nr:von Willebrand factor A-like protein [Gracilaria domingensis]